MSTSTSAILGLIFLGLANASVFLMFKLWGYPFRQRDAYECRAPLLDAASTGSSAMRMRSFMSL